MNHLISNILCTAITVLRNRVQQLQPSTFWNTGISSQKGSAKNTVQTAEIKIPKGMGIKLGHLFYISECINYFPQVTFKTCTHTSPFTCPTIKEQSMTTSSCKKARPTCYAKPPIAQNRFVPILYRINSTCNNCNCTFHLCITIIASLLQNKTLSIHLLCIK